MKNFYFLLIALLCSAGLRAQCPITVGSATVCAGQNTATLTASSGATSYTWNPGGINSATIAVSPTVTTTYTVIGTDGVCTDSTTVTVTVNPLPAIVANSAINPICQFQQPTVLSASGASTYTWSPGFGLSSATGSQVQANPTVTTVYTVTGTDANGCYNSATVMVGVVGSPMLNFSVTPAGCGACNGSATVFASGGSAPYTYTWSPSGSNAQMATGLCAGAYSCTIMDINGCYGANVVTVPSSGISFTSTPIAAACGQSNGSITIDSIQGGTPPYRITYQYNGMTSLSPTNVISNLPAGTYVVNVEDTVTQCMGSQTVTINNSNFIVSATVTPSTCNQCDGAISTSIVGGSAPYSYSWSNGATTDSIGNLCVGNYQLNVTDSNGCFTSTTAVVISPAAPVIQVTGIQHVTCNGVNTGSVSISVSGGSPPYSYLWNTIPAQTNDTATNLTPGNYIVTVTDNLGCGTSQSIYIANNSTMYVYATAVNPVNCSAPGSATVSTSGGIAPCTYSWNNGATGPSSNNLTPGLYTITVVDGSGCTGTGYVNIISQCYNVIKGRLYYDYNSNCVQDAGESGMPYVTVSANNATYGSSDVNGDYTLHTTSLNNVVRAYPSQNYLTPVCPSSTLAVNFSQAGDTLTGQDFSYFSVPYFDLSIHPGWSSAYPGMQKQYWVYFANDGTLPQNVMVRLTYDPILQYDSCNSNGVHTLSQHKIEWTFNNVPANTWWNWQTNPRAYFTVPVTTPLNYNLNTLVEIFPISGDIDTTNNVVQSADPVTGSRDPNAKYVSPKGTGSGGDILVSDSVLQYTVHFQNNGNDTAYRVVVIDTLSSFLDPSTIVPGAANYEYKFTLSGQGICTWTFDSIMLPDSLTNEPASNGYFTYTVKQKPNNPLGSVIKNTAYIYFDYNPAVVTNTTINTITSPVAVPEHVANSTGNELTVYPNPTSDRFIVRFKASESLPATIEIRNIMGELVSMQTSFDRRKGTRTEEFSTDGLANGVYLLRVMCGTQQQTQKLIIQK